MLCFVFAAQKGDVGDLEGAGIVVSIRGEDPLMIRLTSSSTESTVGIGPNVAGPVLITPWSHGSNEYTLVIDENQVSGGDFIEVICCNSLRKIADPSFNPSFTWTSLTTGSPRNNREFFAGPSLQKKLTLEELIR